MSAPIPASVARQRFAHASGVAWIVANRIGVGASLSLISWGVIDREERSMTQKFGEDCRQYLDADRRGL